LPPKAPCNIWNKRMKKRCLGNKSFKMLNCGNHLYCHLIQLGNWCSCLLHTTTMMLKGSQMIIEDFMGLAQSPMQSVTKGWKRTLVCNSSPNWWKQPKNDLVSYYTWDTNNWLCWDMEMLCGGHTTTKWLNSPCVVGWGSKANSWWSHSFFVQKKS